MLYPVRYPLPTKNRLFLSFTEIFRRLSQNSLSAVVFPDFCSIDRSPVLMQTGCQKSGTKRNNNFSGSDTRTTIQHDTRAVHKFGETND